MAQHRHPPKVSLCVHGTILGVLLLLGTVMIPATAIAGFKSFDLPDAQSVADPDSINSNGDIAGYYLSSKDNRIHGFVRLANGEVKRFEAKGSGTGFSQGTWPFSINDDGAVTGSYTDDEYYGHGFVRQPDGKIAEFDAGGTDTFPMSINAKGWVTGSYNTEGTNSYGFLRAPDGTVTTLGLPESSQPLSINDKRKITGYYLSDYSGVGFLTSYRGNTKIIQCPGAASTAPTSVNDNNVVVGNCGAPILNGFIRRADGTIVVFQPPGSFFTQAMSINKRGDVTGWFNSGLFSNPVLSFVRFADGKIKTFNVPGAGTGRNQGTEAQAINNAGIITGFYFDSSEHCHGFVGTP